MWKQIPKGDQEARKIADRHYNRQKVGSPYFLPPGNTFLLVNADYSALWGCVYQKYSFHAWPNTINNCIFRNESLTLSSEMILEATKLTLEYYKDYNHDGLITFVNPFKIKSINPGYCYKMAGWKKIGNTKKGLLVYKQ